MRSRTTGRRPGRIANADLAAVLAMLVAGCAEPADDAVPSDARTSDDEATDTSPGDTSVIDTAFAPDGDAECTCSRFDPDVSVLVIGAMSLPCYCAKGDWTSGHRDRPTCPSYDSVLGCADGAPYFALLTYAGCNLIAVDYAPGNAVDLRFYDAANHELVGALRGDDFVVSTCGGVPVNAIQSGVVPGPECEIAKVERPCMSDAGAPANDGD